MQRAGPPAAPPGPRAVLLVGICCALAAVTLVAFGGLLSSGFINYDDTEYVTENTHVQKGMTGESVAWAFTSTDAANWHPLTWLSHMLDVQLFGMNPGRHHGTSLLLHILNVLLLFLLLLWMTGALWRSAFVAALFALHPLHVESVAWIAERKDVLSTLFWLLTLGAWLRYVKSKKAAPYALALAFFALGLMAKPMLVTLPFTLLLLDYWPLRRLAPPLRWRSGALKGLLWEKTPFFLMSAASCVITVAAQRSGGAMVKLGEYGFFGRLENAALAYAAYLGKTLWPSSLAVFYPHPRTTPDPWPVLASVLLLAGATVLAVRLAKRAPYLPFGWFWYLGTLVPVIGLVQVGSQAMADRYTYIPLVGVFIAVAWGLAGIAGRIPHARAAAPCLAAASLAVFLPVTCIQAGHWRNTTALFEHTLAVTSDNYVIQNNLGGVLSEAKRYPEAIGHLEQALRIKPDSPEVLDNLGMVFEKTNRLPEALELFRKAVRINPDFADAQCHLGIALAGADRQEEAVGHFRRALKVKPGFLQALDNLGLALEKTNRLSEAVESFRSAVRINPDFAEAQDDLGSALAYTGQHAEAVEHYRQALRIKPDNPQLLNKLGVVLMRVDRLSEALECFQKAVEYRPDFAEAHNNLGYLLYQQNRIPEAMHHFTEALRIRPDYAYALDNLGLALEAADRIPEAIERFQQALRIDPGSADTHCHLGTALARERRPAEAMEQFHQALRIEPDDAEALAGLQDLQKVPGQGR